MEGEQMGLGEENKCYFRWKKQTETKECCKLTIILSTGFLFTLPCRLQACQHAPFH